MKFKPTLDIWNLSDDQLKSLPAGQWVSAGSGGPKGFYCGVRESGSVVVGWQGNARGSGDYRSYRRSLMSYGRPTQ